MAHQGFQSRQGRRVAPAFNSCNVISIRSGRKLHIKRINPKERDEKFEKEMQVYLQYRENGLVGVPLIGNQRRQKSNINLKQNSHQDINRPDVVISNTDILQTSELESSKEGTRNVSNQLQSSGSGNSAAILPSPSRESNVSRTHSVQSTVGVQLSITRPSSDYHPMDGIVESEGLDRIIIPKDCDTPDSQSEPKLEKTPRRTKGHRPVSAKNLKTAKSIASSDISDNLNNIADDMNESSLDLHQTSSLKDATLFFIHGVGGSADVWNAQVEYFSSLGMEVIVPDLIGHGFSPSPDNVRAYHFNEILADMEAVFDKFCKKVNVIIGHSYGCAFAAALGRRRSRRVTKLILISGGAPIPLAPQPGVFMLPVCMLSCIKPCLFSKFERNAFHNVKDSGLSKDVAFDVPTYVLSHMMNGQDWMDGDDLFHQWLSMPTLLLHGRYDRFVSLEEEQTMEKAIYFSKLVVIDNCSHMLMMEAPKQVNQVIYDFIFSENNMGSDRSINQSDVPLGAKSARIRAKSSKSSKQLA